MNNKPVHSIYRIGIGYDLHRLTEGRSLWLGGVQIPHNKGLLGHSDADVLIHAIIDAMLGALCLGDIGTLYPDDDPKYKDIDSKVLLQKTKEYIYYQGWKIVNIDSTIVAEQPRLKPFISPMRTTLCTLLSIPYESLSIKAKTNEKVGPEGREEAISAIAVVLLAFTPDEGEEAL